MDTTAPLPPPTRSAAPVEGSRPFGAHLRMSWWKPLVLIPSLLVITFVLQILLSIIVVFVEMAAFGRDPLDMTMSPLMLLATNLSLALMGPLAVLATALLARVPWRSLLASPQRPSKQRWGVYLGAFTILIGVALAISAVLAPQAGGLKAFAVTGTTVGLIVVAVLSTPLQAAGEELMFRGAVMPAVASWARAAKPAVIVGMIGSTVAFGLMHMSVDPWLLAYYLTFGACMAAMAVMSRGLEAPIAFHTVNNLIMMIFAALFAGGGGLEIDRSVGMGGPFMLVFIVVDLLAVGFVWLYERRQRP